MTLEQQQQLLLPPSTPPLAPLAPLALPLPRAASNPGPSEKKYCMLQLDYKSKWTIKWKELLGWANCEMSCSISTGSSVPFIGLSVWLSLSTLSIKEKNKQGRHWANSREMLQIFRNLLKISWTCSCWEKPERRKDVWTDKTFLRVTFRN